MLSYCISLEALVPLKSKALTFSEVVMLYLTIWDQYLLSGIFLPEDLTGSSSSCLARQPSFISCFISPLPSVLCPISIIYRLLSLCPYSPIFLCSWSSLHSFRSSSYLMYWTCALSEFKCDFGVAGSYSKLHFRTPTETTRNQTFMSPKTQPDYIIYSLGYNV